MKKGYCENILEAVGNTPLVRLNRVTDGVRPAILAKLENLNPGGSVKDRAAIGMVMEARKRGLLRPGGTIIESTSGNTGVGLAVAAAVWGYKCVFAVPDKMSREKIGLMQAFGARVIVTPADVEPADPRSYYSVADRLGRETPDSFYVNQFANEANPRAHFETTGPEIWEATGGRLDAFVCGIGTGGTISGVARFLKGKNPAVRIVGADPAGSIYYDYFHEKKMVKPRMYQVEGIGEEMIPDTLDLSVIDDVIQVSDADSFEMARRLPREEGILCGGSSGTALAAALQVARTMDAGQTVVVLFPDTGERYLSKIFDDEWMKENGF